MRGDVALIRSLEYMTLLVEGLGEDQEGQIVSALLLALKLPARKDGYAHLVHAVELYRKDPTQGIVKELYPAVAARSAKKVTWRAVERSIREIIDQAWRDCDEETWKLFFPTPGDLWARPSNGDFIARLARIVNIWLGIRERNAG